MAVTTLVFRGLLLGALAAALLSGCARERPLYQVDRHPVPQAAQSLTLEQIGQHIVKAGARAGWEVRSTGPGTMVGRKDWHGRHTAVVAIAYDREAFSIRYRSSVRLLHGVAVKDHPYEGQTVIHRRYNEYVQALERSILRELSAPVS